MDPDVVAQLDAVDATLAGEPVDPRHAELAELALLLAAARPAVDPEFARELDARVARRFAPGGGGSRRSRATVSRGEASRGEASRSSRSERPGSEGSGSRPRWRSLPALGGGLAGGLAALVAVILVAGTGPASSGPGSRTALGLPQPTSEGPGAVTKAAQPASGASAKPASGAPGSTAGASTSGAGASTPARGSSTPAPASSTPAGPQPPANARKIVQAAELQLTAGATRIDDVAQEVFDVIGSEHGVVQDSNVTATGGPDGYAHFDLGIPSANLPDAMARLSRLRYARVASRTDTTQDVNGQFVDAGRRLADARGLRTALLRQLAGATTANQLASLRAQLSDAEAAITRAQADLAALNRRVNLSSVSVTLSASAQPVPVPAAHGNSFTLTRALHDAGRVLTVAAGAALIALAVLVPIALVAALAWWLWSLQRHRRREQALDLA
jgi:hypothetical protein